MLYPLKFKPRFKERIWGGDLLSRELNKKLPKDKLIGESWELSGVTGDLSVVASGALAGNNIEELIEVYMGDLVGDKIYDKFGFEFPLLFKLIDAQDVLSIQVHPDDVLARERHNSYGKTEMWYVVGCESNAALYVGFNRLVNQEEYLEHLENGTLADILTRVEVKAGDAFFIPAGTIHAIGKGLLVAEIQQTSDITYRVFDWNRTDESGKARELHTELATDAINFGAQPQYNVTTAAEPNKALELAECQYFTTNIVGVDGELKRDYSDRDSFVAYMLLSGSLDIIWSQGVEKAATGDTILIPACIDEVTLKGNGKLLEVYI